MKQKISTSITYIITFLGMAPNRYPQFWPCIYSLWYHHIRISLEHQEKPFQNQVYNLNFNTFFISSLHLLFLPDSSQKSLLILLPSYPHPINQSLRHTTLYDSTTPILSVFSQRTSDCQGPVLNAWAIILSLCSGPSVPFAHPPVILVPSSSLPETSSQGSSPAEISLKA